MDTQAYCNDLHEAVLVKITTLRFGKPGALNLIKVSRVVRYRWVH